MTQETKSELLTQIEEKTVALIGLLIEHHCNFILTINEPSEGKDIRRFNGNAAWIIGESEMTKLAVAKKLDALELTH